MKSAPPARVLLGQWFANGDCLLATAVARQIKADFPGCHLTWAVASRFRAVLRGNPDVDAFWEIELPPDGIPDYQQTLNRRWDAFEREAADRQARGEFTHVFLTHSGGQRHLHLYDGTVRGLIFGGYGRPITVPVAPELRLDATEIANVRRFVEAHPPMTRCRKVVLFECSPKSGQSAVNPAFALELGRRLLAEFDDICLVLSSNLALDGASDPRLVDASCLTFRENAELTKFCTFLIGCSSGLTWLSTPVASKPLPTVQILTARAPIPNSLAVDFERRGVPTDDIIELVDADVGRAFDCLTAVWREGFLAARARFHERISLARSYEAAGRHLLYQGHYLRAVRYWWRILQIERWQPALVTLAVRSGLRYFPYGMRHWRIFRPWRRWRAARRPAEQSA